MDTVQLSTQIRRLIAEGELETAARTLLQYLDQEGLSSADKARFQVYNQALYQVAQLNELQDQVIRGIISTEDADLKRNRIREALLEISEGVGSLDPTHLSPHAAVPLTEDSLGKKRRIALILILGIPLSIMMVMLVFGIKMCTWVQDNILTVEEPTQQQEITRNQQGATAGEEIITLPPPDKLPLRDSIVITGMMTGLLMRPEVMELPFMELPNNTEYKILDVKKVKWAGPTQYFFKIKHDRYEGWVRQVELEFVSPECLR